MKLEFTPEAKTTLDAMKDRVRAIEANYGTRAEETYEAVRSLAFCLATVIGLGGQVSKEPMSDLSLYGQNEHIAYGVNWTSKYGDKAGSPKDLVGYWSVNT